MPAILALSDAGGNLFYTDKNAASILSAMVTIDQTVAG